MGNFHFALDEFFEDAETIEAGHFYVEENEVGDVFFDEGNGFDSIFAFGDEIDFGKTLEEEGEFFSRGPFVVNGNGAGATGIQALTTGVVNSAATVNILNASGGSALLAGTSPSVTNSGNLSSVSNVAPVVDLANGSGTTFSNSGAISAVSPAAVAVRGSAGNDMVNIAAGSIRGMWSSTKWRGSGLRWRRVRLSLGIYCSRSGCFVCSI